MMHGRTGLLMAALTLATLPSLQAPVLQVKRRIHDDGRWAMKPDPDDRGRRAEKDVIALAKAEAKRQRKAAKRLGQKVGAGDTALKGPNV